MNKLAKISQHLSLSTLAKICLVSAKLPKATSAEQLMLQCISATTDQANLIYVLCINESKPYLKIGYTDNFIESLVEDLNDIRAGVPVTILALTNTHGKWRYRNLELLLTGHKLANDRCYSSKLDLSLVADYFNLISNENKNRVYWLDKRCK